MGVDESQSHSEQRRIRTINIVALVAFGLTIGFSVPFTFVALTSRRSDVVWTYVIASVGFLALFLLTLRVNAAGHHEWAVVVLLVSGVGNLVVATLFTGFTIGAAVFMVIPIIAAVLLTRPEDGYLRWALIGLALCAYVVLVAVDPPTADWVAGTPGESILRVANYFGMVAFAVAVVRYQRRLADTAEDALAAANRQNEDLLLNILPVEIAQRLKAGEAPIADRVPAVTVLFADIVGFTDVADRTEASDLVGTLDALFSAFDDIVHSHGLEKIKTVGDNYFAVSGLRGQSDHVAAAAGAALEMRDTASRYSLSPAGPLQVRIGLHTGPVVAGVIGKRKFSYDLWGDTVNTASRMESSGMPGKIQISEQVRALLPERFLVRLLGTKEIKGKGKLMTYELVTNEPSTDSAHPAEPSE